MTASEAVEAYLKKCKARNLSANTLENYHFNLLTFIRFYSGDITRVSEDTIDEYVGYLQDLGINETTLMNKLNKLRSFLKWCQEKGWVDGNLKVYVTKPNEPEIIPLDTKQLNDLYEACLMLDSFCRYRDYVIMRTLEETGMRITEALQRTINDVNLESCTITMSKTKNRKNRVTFITPELRKELLIYLDRRSKIGIKSNWFFCKEDGQPLARRTLERRMSIYGDKAGIDSCRVSPHTLRHTFAKNFLIQGGDLFTLQELLGHSTLDMVKRYARLFAPQRQQVYLTVMQKVAKKKKADTVKEKEKKKNK